MPRLGFGMWTMIAWSLFNLLDLSTTVAGLHSGIAEANALPALVISLGGVLGFVAYKLALILAYPAVVGLIARRYRKVRIALPIITAALVATVIWNILVIATHSM